MLDEVFAFSVERVSRLTGLSVRQLRYWDKTEVFGPEFANGTRRQAYSRVYSFRDVVGLRTLAQLRRRVPLQELRKIGEWLKERYDAPWSTLRFYVQGRRVFFDDPATGLRVATRPRGQAALTMVELEPIVQDVRAAIQQLSKRGPNEIGTIARHRHVLGNAPVLAGTRIPTAILWDFHQAGYGTQAILEQYPQLAREDIEAALTFEEQARHKRVG